MEIKLDTSELNILARKNGGSSLSKTPPKCIGSFSIAILEDTHWKRVANILIRSARSLRILKIGKADAYFFTHISPEIHIAFPHLQHLVLQQLKMSESMLLATVKSSSECLKDVTLSTIRISGGTWIRTLKTLIECPALVQFKMSDCGYKIPERRSYDELTYRNSEPWDTLSTTDWKELHTLGDLLRESEAVEFKAQRRMKRA